MKFPAYYISYYTLNEGVPVFACDCYIIFVAYPNFKTLSVATTRWAQNYVSNNGLIKHTHASLVYPEYRTIEMGERRRW